MRQNDGAFAGGGLHASDDMKQIGIVPLLSGRFTPREALIGVVRRIEAGGPFLVGKRWIGDHVIVGAQLFVVLELGVHQRIAI
ncbi:hypothetical protein D3C72_1977050 [compost metagenome]